MCFKRNPPVQNLQISGEALPFVSVAKILGLWVQNDLKWNTHVDNLLAKSSKKLFMLRSLKRFGFSTVELRATYNSYVRPVLEYADVIWHSGINTNQSSSIESVQKRACKIILGTNYQSYESALQALNIDLLSTRRECHCLKFATNIQNNERCNFLFPPSRLASHGKNLRNSHNISKLPAKTRRFQTSPIPYYIELINSN